MTPSEIGGICLLAYIIIRQTILTIMAIKCYRKHNGKDY